MTKQDKTSKLKQHCVKQKVNPFIKAKPKQPLTD